VILVLTIAAAVIVWLIVKGDDNGTSSPGRAPANAVTVATLRNLHGSVGHEVYWAGSRPKFTYELTEVGPNIFIRYLPAGVGVGDPRPSFLTVGTYPRQRSYAVLAQSAKRPGNTSRRIAGRGIALWSDARPQSVYVAYPGSKVQIEVYDPSAARARSLVFSGAVKPLR
jgi:hypothetical protein